MDIKQLIEKMDQFAGQAVGQKPGEQWKGTDKGTPGKKLVGGDEQQEESVLKDLSKGPTPKTKEQELAEEWATFSEENIGTHPKRPRRTSDRHSRGHEPQARYKTVKADEAANPAQQAAIAIAMKKAGKKPKNEGTVYKATNTHPASRDPIVATVVKQMRPDLKNLDMSNEAFLYFAYELGKQRARDAWEDYLPAIRDEYEKGLNEASYYGPVEARWMVKLSDDEGDHLKTYHDKFPSLSAAKKAYKKYEPYASDFKYKPVKKDQVEEAIDSDIVQPMGQDPFNRGGFNPIRDQSDYLKRRSEAWNLLNASNTDPQTKAEARQQILDLDKQARAKNYIQSESRGHTIIANKLKDVERAKKFASGELKIPTPQERQAQLAKQKDKKEKVDEYGAGNPPQGTTITTPTAPQKVDPKQAQQLAQNLNVEKTALGQLKQLNPSINPQKAAMAATKDIATMNPQEKEVLAQVAKTLSPALGSPAFGSIKTALQKAKNT